MVLKLRGQTDSAIDGEQRQYDERGDRKLSLVGALVAGLKTVLMGDGAALSEHRDQCKRDDATPHRAILVVQRVAPGQAGIAKSLCMAGHKVLVAKCASEAISILQYWSADALVLDYDLDDTDGASLLHIIREEHLSDAPALFVSADHTPIALRAMREAGSISVLQQWAPCAAIEAALAAYDAGDLQPDPKSQRPRHLAHGVAGGWKTLELFNLSVIRRCQKLSAIESGFGELLDLSPKEWAQMTETLIDLLGRGHVVRVRHYAHTLKGSASQLGALRLAEIMKNLTEEKAAKVFSQRGDWAADVSTVAAETIAGLQAILAQPFDDAPAA